jgi:hypothetical protein
MGCRAVVLTTVAIYNWQLATGTTTKAKKNLWIFGYFASL